MNGTVKYILSFVLAAVLALGITPAVLVYAQENPTVVLELNNYSDVPLETLQALAKQAELDGVSVELTVDQIRDGIIVSRLALDPKLSTRSVACEPSVGNAHAVNTEMLFKRWFRNELFVIATGQEESYGQPVKLVVKPELEGFEVSGLHFYSYSPKTGSYQEVEKPGYRIDENGYLHFTTEYADRIVVSAGALEGK